MEYISTAGLRYESVPHAGCQGCAFDQEPECGKIHSCANENNELVIWKLSPVIPVTTRTYLGKEVAQALSCHLVAKSVWFAVTPKPDDYWEFEVKVDALPHMPVENTERVVLPTAPVPGKDWTANTGMIIGALPVPRGSLVDVKHRDGGEYWSVVAGAAGFACDWHHTGEIGDIMFWRLSQPS